MQAPLPADAWRRLFELLDTALDLPDDERVSWLERLESAGEPLTPKLRELLASRAQIETLDFIGASAAWRLPHGAPLPAVLPGELREGVRVGAYRLLHEVGAGGMGAVWLAERADGLFKRPVALKLPHAGPRARLFAERFAREREILAALEHPHIARLYDAGVSADGQPFIALEYVEGETLPAWCDRRRLGVAARVALFIDVLHALQHAHGRLIVHRDVKPGNILVATDGQVKLLDFGIAKLLDAGPAQATALTRLGGGPITPAYASPEQLRGAAIGVASDIYSAGVVLHELLTGRRPHAGASEAPSELEAVLAADEAPPAHRVPISDDLAARRASSPARLAAALAGDLGTVLARALKKSPLERYATADAFAQDLAACLVDAPIRARPDTAWYRTRKFAQRHRVAVGLGAAAVAALAAGLGVALWQAQLARQQAARADEIKRAMVGVFTEANPIHGGGVDVRAVDLLLHARERIERDLAGRPDMQLELLCSLAVSLANLSAIPQARATYEAALALGGGDSERRLECRLDHALLLNDSDAVEAGSRMLGELEPVLRARGPSVTLGKLLMARSAQRRIEGRNAEAVAAAEEAAAVTRRASGDASRDYVNTLLQLGRVQHAAGKLDAALASADEALIKLPRAVGTDRHPDMPLFRVLRASVLSDLGRRDEAADEFRRSLPAIAASFGEQSQEHVVDLHYFAVVERQRGDLKHAIALSEQAIALARRGGLSKDIVAALFDALVISQLAARQLDAAQRSALEAVTLGREVMAAENSRLAAGEAALAFVQALVDGGTEARQRFEASVDRLRQLRSPQLATALRRLGELHRRAGRPGDAVAALNEAVALAAAGDARQRQALPLLRCELALAWLDLDRADAAEPLLQSALGELERGERLATPARADVHLGLARLQLARGQPAQAVEQAAQADSFWRETDPANTFGAEAAYWHARSLDAAGRGADARAAWQRARPLFERSTFALDRSLAGDAERRSAGR